jgi:hypothetical protein
LTSGCLLFHMSYFSWCILVILYGDVILLMSLGGGVLVVPLMLNVWRGTYLMFDGVSTFLMSPFPMVLMWCGHTLLFGGIVLGDINLYC